MSTEELADRLWSRVEKRADGCWDWLGSVNVRRGHGQVSIGGRKDRKVYYAHRLAWELTYGPIPDGMAIVHTCYNARCCSPDHLFMATIADAARMARGGRPAGDPITRFWGKVEKSPDCWTWTSTTSVRGYGVFSLPGRGQVKAHRYAYELLVGQIPDGLVIDHLCRNTLCVNPSHLEPVTNAENVLRGFSVPAINARRRTCSKGHEYREYETNRRNGRRKRRYCLICKTPKVKGETR